MEGGEAGEEVGNDDNDDCYEPGADMEDIDNQSDSCGKLNVNGLNKYFKSIPKNANYAQWRAIYLSSKYACMSHQ